MLCPHLRQKEKCDILLLAFRIPKQGLARFASAATLKPHVCLTFDVDDDKKGSAWGRTNAYLDPTLSLLQAEPPATITQASITSLEYPFPVSIIDFLSPNSHCSSMQEARDNVYSHLIARRAVARAALHLGTDSMTAEAMDSLAGVLTSYLERVGKTVAVTVEASGRSSAHSNVLDALRAVEMCTSPAVQRVHRDPSTTEQDSSPLPGMAAGSPREELSWKGLAAFCFGPEWHMPPRKLAALNAAQDQADQDEENDQELEATGAGGKVFPSASAAGVGDSSADQAARRSGWMAPYPDELPAFPVAAARISNPHVLSQQSLHGLPSANMTKSAAQTNKELEEIPDAFFGWGQGAKPSSSIETTAAVGEKRKDTTPDTDAERPRKKTRFNSETGAGDEKIPVRETAPYVPSFFPPFPRPSDTLARTVLDLKDPSAALRSNADLSNATAPPSQADTASDPNVRSALVQLGEQQAGSYWGSGWEAPAPPELAVPTGRSSEAGGPAPRQIVPLNRASGHPVSRILEGSMDAATMQ